MDFGRPEAPAQRAATSVQSGSGHETLTTAPRSGSGFGCADMDADLLAALDDVLSFPHESLADAFGPPGEPLATPSVSAPTTVSGDADMTELLLSLDIPDAATQHEQSLATVALGPPQTQMKDAPSPATVTQPEPPQTKRGKAARAAPYPKTKPRRRKRPKDELDYLRAKVTDLEDELSKLGQKNAAARNGGHSPESGSSSEDDEVFVRWKKIADRQKEEANSSVIENLKLRAMLEGQLQVARTLEAAISQHQKEAVEVLPWQHAQMMLGSGDSNGNGGNSASITTTTKRPRATSMPDELLFMQLNASLDTQYAEVDAQLKASGVADIHHEIPQKLEVVHGADGISFQDVQARVLPFPVMAVHRAMWSVLLNDKMLDFTERCQTRVVDSNSMHATIVDTLQLPKSHRTVTTMRIAVRRYFEADRVVVVWNSYMEIDGSVFVRLHDKGWSTANSMDIPRHSGPRAMEDTAPGCILRASVRMLPEIAEFDSKEEAREHVGEMTDLVIGTYHRNCGLMFQIVENLLLGEAMSSGGAFTQD